MRFMRLKRIRTMACVNGDMQLVPPKHAQQAMNSFVLSMDGGAFVLPLMRSGRGFKVFGCY